MSIETMLDGLPVWDKKIAEWMKPVEPFFNLILVGIIVLCMLAIFYLSPQYKALWLAYLISP